MPSSTASTAIRPYAINPEVLTTPDSRTFTITPRGPFSLRESAEFGFGQRQATSFDGVMRLAFTVDGYEQQAGVALHQEEDGAVAGELYVLGHPATPDEFRVLAENWRPWRIWATVLLRAASSRL